MTPLEAEPTHLESMWLRLKAIDLLKQMKRTTTYEELSKRTSLPITVLNRYIKGHVLPSHKRAKQLIQALSTEFDLKREITQRVAFNAEGYFDNYGILSDLLLMRRCAELAKTSFEGIKIDKVLTAATDGIPIAVLIANEFGVDIVYSKNRKEIGVKEFLEETYSPGSSGVLMSLYLPVWAVKKGEQVLIVDDIIRTGETQKALINLVHKAKANVAGIFVLVGVGEVGTKTVKQAANCPVKIIAELPEPQIS